MEKFSIAKTLTKRAKLLSRKVSTQLQTSFRKSNSEFQTFQILQLKSLTHLFCKH